MDHLTRLQRREEARRRVRRRRRLALGALAGAVALVVLGVVLSSSGGAGSDHVARTRAARRPAPPPELPLGGRTIFPRFRVVAYYGAPQAKALGALGIGSPAHAARRLAAQARPYRRGGRPLLLAFELIATVASGAPGKDGRYSYRQSDAVVRRYLVAARRAKALLILDFQPGHSSFMDEVHHFAKFLPEPDVGLALDPEWHLPPGQVPGRQIGSSDASEVNAVSGYLADLVRTRHLPEKLLVVHEFTNDMIRHKGSLQRPPGIALTLNVDGFGTHAEKIAKYRDFTHPRRPFHHGFKLFYEEDTNTMSPRQVLRLRPQPELVVYE